MRKAADDMSLMLGIKMSIVVEWKIFAEKWFLKKEKILQSIIIHKLIYRTFWKSFSLYLSKKNLFNFTWIIK